MSETPRYWRWQSQGTSARANGIQGTSLGERRMLQSAKQKGLGDGMPSKTFGMRHRLPGYGVCPAGF